MPRWLKSMTTKICSDIPQGVAVACTEGESVWICQRIDPNRQYPFYWQIGGGTVEDGETVVKALAREALEESEMKLDLSRLRYHGVSALEYPDGRPYRTHWYSYESNGEVPARSEPKKHGEWILVPAELLHKYTMMPGLTTFLMKLFPYYENV